MENRQETQSFIPLLAFDSLLTTSFMIRPRLVVVLLLLHSNTRRDWTMREISESSQKIGKIRLFTKLQGDAGGEGSLFFLYYVVVICKISSKVLDKDHTVPLFVHPSLHG